MPPKTYESLAQAAERTEVSVKTLRQVMCREASSPLSEVDSRWRGDVLCVKSSDTAFEVTSACAQSRSEANLVADVALYLRRNCWDQVSEN